MARVLVVDDDPDHCEVVSKLLQKAGYGTATASNGWEALIALDNGKFDLVLLDLMMPGMDGATFLNILRHDQRRKDLPVLVVSALHPDQVDDAVKREGYQDYFQKADFKLADLVMAVQAHLPDSGPAGARN
jgi:CheY-like chemotaxis protein